MTEGFRQLLEEALRMPEQQRARLAAELLASMEPEASNDVASAWAAEIERRAGLPESDDVDWEDVEAELAAKYPAR